MIDLLKGITMKNTMLTLLFVAALGLGFSTVLSGCNTVDGAGKDLSESSEYVEGKIDKAAE